LNIIKRTKNIFKKLSSPSESLSSRAVKGGFWVFSLRITDRIFQLARTIILARLLSPNDFGVFGIALLVLSTLDTFSQAGFQQALIQKKGETRSYLDTAWTVGLIRGFIIAGVVFFLAKPATIFFKAPAAENILRIIGISIILQSLNNIAVLYFQKELQFHKFFKYQFLGTIADVTIAITFAFLLKSVWALVFGLVAGNLVRCIMSYVIEPYRPRFRFDRAQAKELFGFGRWILGSSILGFLLSQGDDIFVGKMLGATALGFYQVSYRIISLPATEITHVVSHVSFPAYSKIQRNLLKLRNAYSKIFQVCCLLSIFVTTIMFSLSYEITVVFLGEKWIAIVPVIQIFAFAGLIRALGATISPIFQAVGQPKVITQMQVAILISLAILIYPLTIKYGITGAAIASTCAALIPNFWFMQKLIKRLKYSTLQILREIGYPFIAGLITSLFIFILKYYLSNINKIITLILLFLLGLLVFFLVNYFFTRFFSYKAISILKSIIKSI